MNDFSNISAPGKYLADTIPPLGRLPPRLQWWRKPLKPYFERQANLWMSLWSSLKTQMETGKAPECFVKQVIESGYEKQGVSELQAAFLAGSLIEAGSETTSAGINTAILYLSAYPEVRAKAFEELSRVVGFSRTPTFEDEPNLPYIRAIAALHNSTGNVQEHLHTRKQRCCHSTVCHPLRSRTLSGSRTFQSRSVSRIP